MAVGAHNDEVGMDFRRVLHDLPARARGMHYGGYDPDPIGA